MQATDKDCDQEDGMCKDGTPDMPEKKEGPARKLSVRLDPQKGGAVTFLQSGGELSSQEEDIVRNVTDAVKHVFQNLGKELLPEISAAAEDRDYKRLCEVLEGSGFWGRVYFAPQDTLRQILDRIGPLPAGGLPAGQAKTLLEAKLFCADRLCDYTGLYQDIAGYLRKCGEETGEEYRQNLVLAQANCAAQEGKSELAYGLYRSVIETAEAPLILAWAHSGLAHTMDPLDPDTRYHEELAGSYFLQGGRIGNYIGIKLRCAGRVELTEPQNALKLLDDALEVCDPDSGQSAEYIMQIRLWKSKIYDRLGQEGSAMDEAETLVNTVDPRRCYGLEPLQIAGYNLLLFLEEKRGGADAGATQSARDRIESLERRLQTEDRAGYEARKRLTEVLRSGDAEQLKDLKPEIDACQEPLLDAVYIIAETVLTGSAFVEQLEQLERLRPYIGRDGIPPEVTALIAALYADTYLKNGDCEKALSWYKKALDINPFLWACRQNYAAILWNEKRWTEAAAFFAQQVARFGDQPHLLIVYGRALLETGNCAKALKILRKAQKLQPDAPMIAEYINRALDLCDEEDLEAESAGGQSAGAPCVTPEGVRQLLSEFSEYVRAEVRMTFWRRSKERAHVWRASPEQHGQTLLHTFVKSRYGGAVEVLEEAPAGAGRIDLYLRFLSGFTTVIELKMCGHGYSEAYSLEGIAQLQHYLENKKVHVGYLLVFDSRTRKYGEGIAPVYFAGDHIIFTSIADVRPFVKPGREREPREDTPV